MLDIKIHRGDIFWIRQDYSAVGSEQKKNRPAIIVSNDKNNTYSETVEIVYLTTAEEKAHANTRCYRNDGQAVYCTLRGHLHNR